jgi:hypothetical protein
MVIYYNYQRQKLLFFSVETITLFVFGVIAYMVLSLILFYGDFERKTSIRSSYLFIVPGAPPQTVLF